LIEALGVLERQKVAEDVKGLDQPRARCCANTACASAPIISICRRCSSRRRAASRRSLDAQARQPGDQGPRRVAAAGSSGRTSIPIDKDTPKPLYRTIGYRVCGERAIRVDIWSGSPT
jgi:ATP-dependent RNA helicase SUPV3L1/SUV3